MIGTSRPPKNKTGNSIGAKSSPDSRRKIGIFSATFLIFNRIIGTGIFATPSAILALAGSVGMSFAVWIVGMVITIAGTAVYLEFGTAIPRNGGEKNYLEYVYRKPKFLATAMYASYALLIAWSAGNSVVFGEYVLHAMNVEVNRWNQRGIGVMCITAAFILHSTVVNLGLRIQNILGVVKLLVILLIVFCGFVVLGGRTSVQDPGNFKDLWGGNPTSAYGVVTALYGVIWSYIGYSNANYALSETRNPVRTLKIAAPLGVISVSVLYLLANVAYFSVVPREEMLGSGRILAASFFRILFGPKAERILSILVALSAFGTVLSVLFSQGRIIQELGREGVLPLSRFWASNRPFDSPAAGLLQHYLISIIVMIAPPPGDAYNFLLILISYPLSVVNLLVSAGLTYIYLYPKKYPDWCSPIRASLPITLFFCASNVYLAIAPFIPPPSDGQNVYTTLPYYIHCIGGLAVFAVGALYWVFWAKVLPYMGGYRLRQETVVGEDGWSRTVFHKVPAAKHDTRSEIGLDLLTFMKKWWQGA
ncbi:hypothetical protein VTO42DRAFT_1300 [Malbranchea cinnamomea]